MTKKTHTHINIFLATTQPRDNPAHLFMFMCFLFPDSKDEKSPLVKRAALLRRLQVWGWGPFPLPSQKNPRVRKIRVRNSGAGNGCANFMDAWKNAFSLQEKPMSIKFLVFGGGIWVWGGGECRFYFYGRADFSDQEIRSSFQILFKSIE